MLKENFLKTWREERENLINKATNSLTFDYQKAPNGIKKKEKISEALAFWEFTCLFLNRPNTLNNRQICSWSQRQEILLPFTKDPNPLVIVVATIESLPNQLWRKLLWKLNIDFMSFESFLRRLQKSQFEGIVKAYKQLWEEKNIPDIFTKRDIRRKKITLESLLNCNIESWLRYKSKASWLYNLLGLGFGFNAFPEGIDDDFSPKRVSPLQFLSVKKHSDDFVVDTEEGKYFKMYKTVRSNFVWRPNRTVKLKNHICPGFWYTLIMYTWFWVLSPVLAGLSVFAWSDIITKTPWYLSLGLSLGGSLTPIWLLVAVIKLIWPNEFLERTQDWFFEHQESFQGIGHAIKVIVVITIFIVAIGGVAYYVTGIASGISMFLFWCLLAGHDTYYDLKKIDHPKKKPIWFKLALVILAAVTIILAAIHKWDIIAIALNWIWNVIQFIAMYVLSILGIAQKTMMLFPVITTAYILVFMLLLLPIIAILLDERKKSFSYKIADMLARIIFWIGFIAASALLIIVILEMHLVDLAGAIAFAILTVASLFTRRLLWSFDPEVEKMKDIYTFLHSYTFEMPSLWRGLPKEALAKNRWFRSLSENERMHYSLRAIKALGYFFNKVRYKKRLRLFPLFVRKMRPEMIGDLERLVDILIKRFEDKWTDSSLKTSIAELSLEFFLSGTLYLDALDKAEALNKKKLRRKALAAEYLLKVSEVFAWIWEQITKLIILYRLWQLFNERCPFVVKGKQLKFQ